MQTVIHRLSALIDRLRPPSASDFATAEANVRAEIIRLGTQTDVAAALGADVMALLAMPFQTAFFAETGVRSALGFWLELTQRISQRILPLAPDDTQLRSILNQLFTAPSDHEWVTGVSDTVWHELAAVLGLSGTAATAEEISTGSIALGNVLEAARVLSYRLTGVALDRELLRADRGLERYESPFMAQNAALIPVLERARMGGALPDNIEIRDVDVLLEQCEAALQRVRRKAGEAGISIRLTYLLARLQQLIDRLRILLDLTLADKQLMYSVRLMKLLLAGEQTRNQVIHYIGDNVSLVARNVTDHASRHGEHYIAEDRAEWWAMGRSAAGGGVIIAFMAMIKIQLSALHLPPLTEGIAFGLNYAIGFVLIHLLGFVVATKQPAMTAAAIAVTIEDARPKELERLGDLAQNVARTQFIAVLGNVGLAVPVACIIAASWPALFGTAIAPPEKLVHMLTDVHPLFSGALFFAAVAGVGLFLSGLVSGYFDNQARYQQLAARIAAADTLSWLGDERRTRFGNYLDIHYGAILGNVFFGLYLGMVGALGNLTGLPIDIRHVAFASANVGTASMTLGLSAVAEALPWAIAGVICIALVNLVVSFSLALYVAMKSRRLGTAQIIRLALLLLRRFVQRPLSFFIPPNIKPAD